MRQVPSYLFIGNGRLAAHFKHYFNLLSLPFTAWQRGDPVDYLYQAAEQASHIFLMIPDDAIETFIISYINNLKKNCLLVHFSGCLITPHAYGAHPLSTFQENKLYDLATYQSIPFLLDENAPDFDILFPDLINPYSRLKFQDKAKYHALCVMGGNFTCLLWQKLLQTFENEFGLKKELAFSYLMQQVKNIITDVNTALTGPLVRGDKKTLEKNILSLENDPYQRVYQSFVSCYEEIQRGEKS
jgi:hypothetical protein